MQSFQVNLNSLLSPKNNMFLIIFSLLLSPSLIILRIHWVFGQRVQIQKLMLETVGKHMLSENDPNLPEMPRNWSLGKLFQRWETNCCCRGKVSFKNSVVQMLKRYKTSFYYIWLQHYCFGADGCFWSDMPYPGLISNTGEFYYS